MNQYKKPSENILLSAYDCLSKKGFANVSMRDIAKESGTALSQLTYYFKTKENMFLEVIDMMMEKYFSEVREKMSKEQGAKKKLSSLIGYFSEIIKKEPKFLRLFVDFTAQAMWNPLFKKKIDSMFLGFSEIIKSEIVDESGKSEGENTSTAKLIFGALYGTSVQILLGSERDEEYEPLNMTQSLLF